MASSDLNRPRLVSSSKVYRQMFDAGVNLRRSLAGYQHDRLANNDLKSKSFHEFEVRQQAWLDTEPYDNKVENPVFYKLKNDYVDCMNEPEEKRTHQLEVENLPDVVVPTKLGSDINERIAISRRKRHESEMENFFESLQAIAQVIEGEMAIVCEELVSQLKVENSATNESFQKIYNEEEVSVMELSELEEIWQSAIERRDSRADLIKRAKDKLQQLEEQRMKEIKEVFSQSSTKLSRICHLMPEQLKDFLDTEAATMNKVILSNRRGITEWLSSIQLDDMDRDRFRLLKWQQVVTKWRKSRVDVIVTKFKAFMSSDDIQCPTVISETVEKIAQKQQDAVEKRRDFLMDISAQFLPSEVISRSHATQLCYTLDDLNSNIDQTNQRCVSWLAEVQDLVIQQCFDEATKLKRELIDNGFSTEKQADRVSREHFFPMIGDLQKDFERRVNEFDAKVEKHNRQSSKHIKLLKSFLNSVTTCWENHAFAMAAIDNDLSKKLDGARQVHDGEIRRLELKLDKLMDRLRQSNNVSQLSVNLSMVHKQLDGIQQCFESFYKDLKESVDGFPAIMTKTVTDYEEKLETTLLVSQEDPEEKIKLALANLSLLQAKYGSGRPTGMSQKSKSHLSQSHLNLKSRSTLNALPDDIHLYLGLRVIDKITFDNNRQYYIMERFADPLKLHEDLDLPTEIIGVDDARASVSFAAEGDDTTDEESLPVEVEEPVPKLSLDGEKSADQSANNTDSNQTPGTVPNAADEANNDTTAVAGDESLKQGDSSGATDPVTKSTNAGPSGKKSASKKSKTERTSELSLACKRTGYLSITKLDAPLFEMVRRKIIFNFLDKLPSWYDEITARAGQVVITKKDELTAELKLRLHLHEPRKARVVSDVHNVRAAEIMLHSDRVDEHIKSVWKALSGRRDELTKIQGKEQQLANRLVSDVADISAKLSNKSPSKQSELDTAKNNRESSVVLIKSMEITKLQEKCDQLQNNYMASIRSELRNIRRNVEDETKRVRQTNSTLIQSFKLFVDGGNFSPDELQEYKEKLDQLSRKVDDFESQLLGELEGIEARHVRHCGVVVQDFEDLSRPALSDALFVEKVQKILTNTQCKIKTELAECSQMYKNLDGLLRLLAARMDSVRNPHVDKERIDIEQIRNFVVDDVFPPVRDFAYFLNVIKEESETGDDGQPVAMDVDNVSPLKQADTSSKIRPARSSAHSAADRPSQRESGARLAFDDVQLLQSVHGVLKRHAQTANAERRPPQTVGGISTAAPPSTAAFGAKTTAATTNTRRSDNSLSKHSDRHGATSVVTDATNKRAARKSHSATEREAWEVGPRGLPMLSPLPENEVAQKNKKSKTAPTGKRRGKKRDADDVFASSRLLGESRNSRQELEKLLATFDPPFLPPLPSYGLSPTHSGTIHASGARASSMANMTAQATPVQASSVNGLAGAGAGGGTSGDGTVIIGQTITGNVINARRNAQYSLDIQMLVEQYNKTLVGKVRAILKLSLETLAMLAEQFYKTKGSRPLTSAVYGASLASQQNDAAQLPSVVGGTSAATISRQMSQGTASPPKYDARILANKAIVLGEHFDDFMELNLSRLKHIYAQIDVFHHDMHLDYEKLLMNLERLVADVPVFVLQSKFSAWIKTQTLHYNSNLSTTSSTSDKNRHNLHSHNSRDEEKTNLSLLLRERCREILVPSDEHRKTLCKSLNPQSGHPENLANLFKLERVEEHRHAELIEKLDEQMALNEMRYKESAKNFIDRIIVDVKVLLSDLDKMITVNDIVRPVQDEIKKPTIDILREKHGCLVPRTVGQESGPFASDSMAVDINSDKVAPTASTHHPAHFSYEQLDIHELLEDYANGIEGTPVEGNEEEGEETRIRRCKINSVAHRATIATRDSIVAKFVQHHRHAVDKSRDYVDRLRREENEWHEKSWVHSINKLKKIHKISDHSPRS